MKQQIARLILFILILATPTLFVHGAQTVTHIIQPGETLAAIAIRYSADLNLIAVTNGIENHNKIRSWQTIEIPNATAAVYNAPASAAPAVQVSAPVSGAKVHVVQRGDTIFSIARRYGVPVDELLRANGIDDPRFIHSGLKLQLITAPAAPPAPPASPPAAQPVAQSAEAAAPSPAPAQPAVPAINAGNREQYIVRRGDSLSEIGVDLNIYWQAIASVNQLENPNVLHTGMVLLLPTWEEELQFMPDDSNVKRFHLSNHHPGPRIGVGREIVIELGTQSAYAYEDGVLRKRALMASGKSATPTLLGDYNIWLKRRSQTMSGPGYSLDNVEWVMYFYLDYAMHGTWWHANFGTPTSHGCVNLTNEDAKWFFEFADIGTPVHVRN